MKRYCYEKIRDSFLNRKKRVLLYGPPYTGKSFLLRALSEEENVKNYILIDLRIDRDFTEGLLDSLNNGRSLCDFACTFFGMKPEYVREKLFLFLDGLEPLGNAVNNLFSMELPEHFAATTSRIDRFGIFGDECTDTLEWIKVRGFSFYEFLDAVSEWGDGETSYAEVLRAHYKNQKPIPEMLEEEIRELFHDYMMVGGYPEAVMQYCRNRTDLSGIRQIQEQLFAGTKMRYKNDVPEEISETKLTQLFEYIGNYAKDNRGAFHPGHIRRGALTKDYVSEIDYLTSNLILHTVYEAGKFHRFEISDCGMLRYLAGDYDVFYKTDNREILPEYFYQNYVFHVLAERDYRINIQRNSRSDYLCYTNGTLGFRHSGAGRNVSSRNKDVQNTSKDEPKIYNLIDRKITQKNADHNIQYYFLEQTQF
jgi:predicted AAA+ superfamily ATPase